MNARYAAIEGFRIRMALVSAIREAEAPEGITLPESIEGLKSAIEKLEEDYRKLKSRIEEQKAL